MGNRENLTGQIFNRLTVIEELLPSTSPIKWVCLCECGSYTHARGSSLKNGNTKSCGCLAKQATSTRFTIHGERFSKLYSVHSSMLTRCNNTKAKSYPYYGARGITVCKEWESFKEFSKWAISTGYQEGLTIERKDVNKDYTPDNCKWMDKALQVRNRRSFKDSTSQYIGVSWNRQYSKWTAVVCTNSINKYLGRFDDEIAAAKARDQYIIDNNLEGFSLNFR